ncbi:MAG: LPS-assembly protein LptD [Methylococcaceae bacterium]
MLLLTASFSFADDALWNCQQDKNTNEWVCLGDTKSAETTDASSAAMAKESEPVETTPVYKPQPVIEEPSKPSLPATVESLPASLPAQKGAASVNKQPISEQAKVQSPSCDNNAPNCKPTDSVSSKTAQLEESDSFNLGLLDAPFDHGQEQIFSVLATRFKADPWENCTAESAGQAFTAPEQDLRNVSPLDVKSNYSEIFDNEIGSYFGNVELNRADQRASSHSANYDSVSQTLDLHGDVYYSEDELALHSDTATLKLDTGEAKLRDTLFVAPSTPLRGLAKAVYRENKFLSLYKDVTYTSCRPGNHDWAVHASELKLNKETGKGSAKNAWLEFKGVPVFYSPYLAFPVDNRRLSGFLAPSFGSTQNSGFNFSTPYYWNIAPNYDATLNPRYFSERGVLLAGDFRYLTEKSKGIASVEFMPDDSLSNESRYLGSLKHHTQFTPRISSNLDLNYVSDDDYFNDLGNALSFPNFSFVKSSADVNYIREGVAFTTQVVSYQTIDQTLAPIERPYKKLPQINLNLNHSFNFMPLDAAMETESVYFQHDSLVDGQRFNVKPSVSFPLQTAATYLTPKISLQHTQYFLNNQAAGLPDEVSRTLPIVSLDSGVYLERELNIGQSPMSHTLEPRLFYLYVPKTDQNDIPVFDSSLYDFWYSSMFRENSFSGSDRVQDANQITAALTSRLIDPVTGRERLRLSIGEIFYFRDREVTIPLLINGSLQESPVGTSSYSPFVAELGSELTEHFSIDTGLQWDPQINEFVRGKAVMHFINKPDQIVNLGYLYRKNPSIPDQSNDITQTDMSVHWPVYDNWSVVGRWQYSWLYNTTQDSFFGLEKENCCWRFRIIGRHYINSINQLSSSTTSNLTVDGTAQDGIFVQIELKGLTGVGEKLDEFFEQSIYGYRKPQND